jgi:hypothetical protein
MYRNAPAFWAYHIERFPHIPWARVECITGLLQAGRLSEAQKLVQEGLQVNANDYGILMYGAVMCLMLGKKKEALICLDECEKNLYLGQEEAQSREVADLRACVKQIKGGS